MEFGRLSSVEHVDFALPGEPPENARVLSAAARPGRSAGQVRIGTAGWSDRGFVGRLYPPGTRPERFLAAHARAFTTNELNSTYYGVSRERIERWAAAVPDGFRFCPKLPSEVTHGLELEGTHEVMTAFARALEGFEEKLGRVWGILPPGFAPDRLGRLAAFLGEWSERLPLAIELRHPGWFADRAASRRVMRLFEDRGVVPVLTDVAGRRDVLHMRLAVPETMIRFVGNRPHPSDFTRLDDWVGRLARWLGGGLETAYVFLHRKHDPDAVELAEHLAGRLRARTGVDPLPELRACLDEARAQQGELY